MAGRHYFAKLTKSTAVVFTIFCAMLISYNSVLGQHQEEDASVLLGKLKDSKLSLVDGIRQAEKANGPAISAKFEMKGDKLMLSVYTAKEGLSKDSEHNVLMELIGDATQAQWTPETEVFEDKPHIARSAMHLTSMQLTGMTLADIVKRASTQQKGTVYSVIPAIRGGKSVFDVLVATPEGRSVHLTLDARTGKAMKERAVARR